MAGIYNIGTPWDTPWLEGIAAAIEVVRQTDQDPIQEKGVFWSDAHEAAGEYIAKIVTG